MSRQQKEQVIDKMIDGLNVVTRLEPRAALRTAVLEDFKNNYRRPSRPSRVLSEVRWLFSRPRFALTGFILFGAVSGTLASSLSTPRLTPEAELSALLLPSYAITEQSYE